MYSNRQRQSGVTIIEALISLVLASLLSLAIVQAYSAQSKVLVEQNSYLTTQSELWSGFALVNSIVKQAQFSSMQINYLSNGRFNEATLESDFLSTDEIEISMRLPEGYPIWPNDIAPYQENIVLLKWQNYGDQAGVLAIENFNGNAGGRRRQNVLGDHDEYALKVLNFDVWPLDQLGQEMAVDALSPIDVEAESGYLVRLDVQGPHQTHPIRFEKVIVPRN